MALINLINKQFFQTKSSALSLFKQLLLSRGFDQKMPEGPPTASRGPERASFYPT
jgi:hypothetical protein